MMTEGIGMNIPKLEEIEIILWIQVADWCDARPGEHEWLDLAVKHYAFKLHCQFRFAVEYLKTITSMKLKGQNDSRD
jgi:hypothetical protein